jgi:hypothetical protein
MALRYIVQEEDEFNAAPFATPNDDMTQYGELVEKRPLLEPYNKQNEIRYTTLVESFPTADDFKNFQKVCCNIITHTNIYIFPTILTNTCAHIITDMFSNTNSWPLDAYCSFHKEQTYINVR